MERTQQQIDAEVRLRKSVRFQIERHEWQEHEIANLLDESETFDVLTIEEGFEIVADEQDLSTLSAREELTLSLVYDFAYRYGFAVELTEDGQVLIYTDLNVGDESIVALVR